MHYPEPVLEMEMHKVLSDYEIQTDHVIPARWTDLVREKKKKEPAELWILPSRPTTE